MVMTRAHEESSMKSIRISRAWEAKRQRARADRAAMTKRCPAWVQVKDERYVEIPERADLVREIFRRAIEGEGKRSIVAEFRKRGPRPVGLGAGMARLLRAEDTAGRSSVRTLRPLSRQRRADRRILSANGFRGDLLDGPSRQGHSANIKKSRTSGQGIEPFFPALHAARCGAGMHYIDKGARSAGPYLICGDYRTGGTCGNGSKWMYRPHRARDYLFRLPSGPTVPSQPSRPVRIEG